MLSILFSLGAALAWGAADFTGGLASRRTGAYRAALYGEFFGLLFIVATAFFIDEPLPDWSMLLLALAAGGIGTTGLLTLFHSVIHGKTTSGDSAAQTRAKWSSRTRIEFTFQVRMRRRTRPSDGFPKRP